MPAIYPGTFDPITNGHLDIVTRAARAFDRVLIAVYSNPNKRTFLPLDERVALVQASIAQLPNVSVLSFQDRLLVEVAREQGASVIIRGLRAISDFESELSMAQINRELEDTIETVFLMTDTKYSFLSSTMIRELASLGADIHELVPPPVIAALAAHKPVAKPTHQLKKLST